MNLHFEDSGQKGWKPLRPEGRRSLTGLGHPTFSEGPQGLIWGWERVNVRREMEGAVSPRQIYRIRKMGLLLDQAESSGTQKWGMLWRRTQIRTEMPTLGSE